MRDQLDGSARDPQISQIYADLETLYELRRRLVLRLDDHATYRFYQSV